MIKKYLYLIILGLLTFVTTAFTSTSLAFALQEIPGVISEDTTLKSENSPYNSTNNLIVNEKTSLSLEPDVILNIQGSLVLKGNIIINQGGKIQVSGNLYRKPGNSLIDEYLNDKKLIVNGKIFDYIDESKPEINSFSPINNITSRTPTISATYLDNESEIDLNALKVILDGKDITSEITDKDASHFTYTPTNPLNYGNHKVQIILSNITGLTITKEWSFYIKDSTAPKFDSYSPASTTTSKRPAITAAFSDNESGINIKTIKVFFDGKDVTSKIVVKNNKYFTYTPSTSLTYGKHYVQVSISNQDGLTSIKKWTFVLYDPKPPAIKIISPIVSKTIYNRHPNISFSISDNESGLNLKTLVIQLDSKNILTNTLKTNKLGYYFIPKYPLSNGKHTVKISVKDKSGQSSSKSWSFTVSTPGFTPGKNELWVEVNQKNQRVYIMKGNNVTKEIICSTGRPSTPTPNGIFKIQNRGKWFLAKDKIVGAKYWVSFKGYGNYMFHSILFDKTGKNIIGSSVRNLGRKASHGCIRLPLSDAIWFYNNIPTNTRVVIFEK